MPNDKFRLVTQPSFDGLACAMLLREQELVEDVAFIHPNDVLAGKIDITDRDIVACLPYAKPAHLVFDHHVSEAERFEQSRNRWQEKRVNLILDTTAPSSARVIYHHFGGRQNFPEFFENMMHEVDRADPGDYRRADVLAPRGWTLFNFIVDPRTGLGQDKDFQTPTAQFMTNMISYCRNHSIDEILAQPDVRERLDLYWEQHYDFIEQVERCSHLEGNVLIVDTRNQERLYAGNRFMIYALFPSATVSIQIVRAHDERSIVLVVRRSIFNHKSLAHIGSIMLKHGGGGHNTAGTCQIGCDQVMLTLSRVVKEINAAS